MTERSWPTMTAGGLCHLVVVEAGTVAMPVAELHDVLETVCTGGDYAIDAGGGQLSVAFTSFTDTERFTSALCNVRPVRQLETRWSSEWFGVYDRPAMRRQLQEIRWMKRASRHAATVQPSSEAGR